MVDESYVRNPAARRRRLRMLSIVLAVAMPAALCLAACGGSSPASGNRTKAGGQLVWGKPAEVDVVDPTTGGNQWAWELLHLVYEGLVELDSNLKVVPKLAESWRQTSPTTYVFTVRKGVRFSTGREMTVDDVAGSLKRVANPKISSFWAAQLGIRKVSVTGADEVTVTLTKPKTAFLAGLAFTAGAILPMKELKAGTFDPKKQLIGTGPYVVTAHSQGESWSFARNPYYWRPGLPKIDKVRVRIMPDDAARVAALRDGSIDITTFDSPDSVPLLKGQPNVKTVTLPTTDYYRLDINAKTSIFRDDRLRQALALSIDRNKIRDLALGGVGRASAAAPVGFNGVCDPAALPFATPDVQKARQLVAAAGATGKTIQIAAFQTIPMGKSISQVMQQNLEAAGLKVRLVSFDQGEAFKRIWVPKPNFDMIIFFYAGFGDPSMVLSFWNPSIADFNKSYVKTDSTLNKLIDASAETPPGPQRIAALRDTCARIAQDANVIPLVSKDTIAAFRSDKINAVFPAVEGYGVPLRRIAEFTPK